MRRSLHSVAAVVAAFLLLAVTPARAEELPPGFTDGVPVGAPDGGSPTVQAGASATEVGTAATQRHFGREAFAAVQSAVSGTSRPCTISNNALIAMVMAPVFKESSAATTPSSAPAPMTLSRYDEWNGVTSSSMGTPENNYGLYAFRTPSTPYKRAFWHPGIGIWQYDTAGLGAPLTTVEAMDAGYVSADVARVMAAKYCNPSATLIGHSAPYTAQERRYSAWSDWGYPCTLCQGFYDEMIGTTPDFANLVLVDGIGPLGGVVPRTCSIAGVAGTIPCWYVNPSVGVIQGATAWATLTPLDGGSTTVAPTPLSLPFYVVDRGATEERHWIRADTGYGIDIRASRQIGKDARPRSTQSGSGLTWTQGSSLCDVTTGRGACGPVAPPGVSMAAFSVAGTYQPVALDANGDGHGDIVWYAPGKAADHLWIGTGPGTYTAYSLNIHKTYVPTVLDADGDGDDDLIWYEPTTGAAHLWRYTGSGSFSGMVLPSPVAGRTALAIDMDADPEMEIFWYGPGTIRDALWDWNGTTYSVSSRAVNRHYRPFTGDFDGNGRTDIFWYAPGSAADSIWYHGRSGDLASLAVTVRGDYVVTVGNLDGDGPDDIFWYGPGSAGDSVWFGGAYGSWGYQTLAVNKPYQPIAVDLFGTGRDALVLYAPGTASDALWTWSAGRVLSGQPLVLPTFQVPVVGPLSTGGADGIFWHGGGSAADVLWFR